MNFKRTLFIGASLQLLAGFALAASLQEFSQGMSTFYLKASPGEFESFQKEAALHEKEMGVGPKEGCLLPAMIYRISEKYSWPITGDGVAAKQALEIREGKSALALYVRDDSQVDPGKLDIWWISFMATGDEAYLAKILTYAGEDIKKAKGEQLLLIGAASWSFKSNCQQHEAVKQFAHKHLVAGTYPGKTAFLKECDEVDSSKAAKSLKEKMTKVVIRSILQDLPNDSFGRKPKTYYQAGSYYSRMEEMPDKPEKIHGLIISNQRDTWMINLYSKTGQHILDTAPTYNSYAPLLPMSGQDKSTLKYFQMGNEIPFLIKNKAEQRKVTQEGRDYTLFSLVKDGFTIELLATGSPLVPYELKALADQKLIVHSRYDDYASGLEPDMNLFVVPAGLQISEAK
jgi:hypothetical protein